MAQTEFSIPFNPETGSCRDTVYNLFELIRKKVFPNDISHPRCDGSATACTIRFTFADMAGAVLTAKVVDGGKLNILIVSRQEVMSYMHEIKAEMIKRSPYPTLQPASAEPLAAQ